MHPQTVYIERETASESEREKDEERERDTCKKGLLVLHHALIDLLALLAITCFGWEPDSFSSYGML